MGEGDPTDVGGSAAGLGACGEGSRSWQDPPGPSSRDRHCTYPGCDVPGQWCDAHHLIHWADHGPTDTDNAGLLCERHHTIVHQRRLAGWVAHDPGGGGSRVEWDLRYGSYDQLLDRLRAKGDLPPPGDARREPA